MQTPGSLSVTRHVLVVDDDALIRTLLAAFLTRLGHRSTLCPDGARASAEVARAASAGTPIDTVLIDLRLGALSGVEVCTRLRAEGVRATIVCMSGDLGAVDRAQLEAAGFDDLLEKPLSLLDLEKCLARHARA
jgi:DNA-binding response OmpR family regulator